MFVCKLEDCDVWKSVCVFYVCYGYVEFYCFCFIVLYMVEIGKRWGNECWLFLNIYGDNGIGGFFEIFVLFCEFVWGFGFVLCGVFGGYCDGV